MGDVLAIAEQRDGKIRGVSNEVVSTAARVAAGLGGKAHALLLGPVGTAGAAGELGRFGAETIRVAESDHLAAYHPQGYAGVVADAVKSGGYAAVVFPATAQGKDLAPRVAALLDVPLASDITEFQTEGGELTAIRPVFSGKAFATSSCFKASVRSGPCLKNAFLSFVCSDKSW